LWSPFCDRPVEVLPDIFVKASIRIGKTERLMRRQHKKL
jgi:hypothetical protein